MVGLQPGILLRSAYMRCLGLNGQAKRLTNS